MSPNFAVPHRLYRLPHEENKEWELAEDLYARLGVASVGALADEVMRVDATTAVCRDNQKLDQAFQEDDQFAPVYRLATSEQLCVATGLVFVILNEGFKLEDCIEQISNTEFSVEKRSPAGGAWLCHQSGLVVPALIRYEKLAEIEAIQSVEPQFLMQRTLRNSKNAVPKDRKATND